MTVQNILVEKDVSVPMRDGVNLSADIYRPDAEGPFPVLLSRIPYGKHFPYYSHRYLDTHRLVTSGYVVILQDVRGRFASEGDFNMFVNEAQDGYDTVEWAATLPYVTGDVGMFGLSYYGFTQLLAAREQPPHLRTIFPAQTLNDPRNGSMYQNGAFSLGLYETLVFESFLPDLIKREADTTEMYQTMMKKWVDYTNHMQDWYRFAPINEWKPLKDMGLATEFFDMIAKRLDDETAWQDVSIAQRYADIDVPAYHVAGWYDCLLNTTLQNYTNLAEHMQQPQKLIIGPWAHGDFGYVIGERSFGVAASEDLIDYKEDLTQLHIRWFDYWLKGEETGIFADSPVKVFVMGRNEWRNEQTWPLERTMYTPYYLHSEGQANTRQGDGRLSKQKPEAEPEDQFIYHPDHPVYTHGGGTLYDGIYTTGPRDQAVIEDRDDVLVYTTEPLNEDTEVTGPVKLTLWAKTDARDTDFTAKLVDVLPDGTAYNLTEGIVRAKYREGYEAKAPLNGDVVRYDIDMWATSNLFFAGHRIRLEVSSSNFPRFDVNPNTGETMMTSAETQSAEQTVYHQDIYASHLLLPIIPKA